MLPLLSLLPKNPPGSLPRSLLPSIVQFTDSDNPTASCSCCALCMHPCQLWGECRSACMCCLPVRAMCRECSPPAHVCFAAGTLLTCLVQAPHHCSQHSVRIHVCCPLPSLLDWIQIEHYTPTSNSLLLVYVLCVHHNSKNCCNNLFLVAGVCLAMSVHWSQWWSALVVETPLHVTFFTLVVCVWGGGVPRPVVLGACMCLVHCGHPIASAASWSRLYFGRSSSVPPHNLPAPLNIFSSLFHLP